MKISIAFCVAVIAFGVALLLISLDKAEFTDARRAEEVMAMEPPQGAISDEAFNRTWHEQMGALRTSKFAIQDLGSGMITIGAIFLALVAWKRASLSEIIWSAQSPSSVPRFLGLLAVSWLLFIPSIVYTLLRDLGRHEFPWWADSVAIPLAGTPFLLVPLPFLILIGFALVRSTPLPVWLWMWDADRLARSWISTAIFACLAFLMAIVALRSCADGDFFAILGALIGVYLALSVRAVMVARGNSPGAWVGALIIALFSASPTYSADRIAGEEAACNAAKESVAKVIRPNAGPTSKWWCDFLSPGDTPSDFYVIGLHSGQPCPADTLCSSLIGWFAVRKRDSRVFGWDMAEDALGNPL